MPEFFGPFSVPPAAFTRETTIAFLAAVNDNCDSTSETIKMNRTLPITVHNRGFLNLFNYCSCRHSLFLSFQDEKEGQGGGGGGGGKKGGGENFGKKKKKKLKKKKKKNKNYKKNKNNNN